MELESNRTCIDEIYSQCRVCRVWSIFPFFPLRENCKLTLGKTGSTLHTLHTPTRNIFIWIRKTIFSYPHKWDTSRKWNYDEWWWV